jgi:hypothetical protein
MVIEIMARGGVEVAGYFVWAGEEREEVRGETIRGGIARTLCL